MHPDNGMDADLKAKCAAAEEAAVKLHRMITSVVGDIDSSVALNAFVAAFAADSVKNTCSTAELKKMFAIVVAIQDATYLIIDQR